MRLLRAADHRRMRWANGGGYTSEIVASPTPDDWWWRVSLAEIDHDSPFSVLPGVRRVLAVVDGKGMTLVRPGGSVSLGRFDVIDFPGDEACRAELHDGPVRDLNVMVRRVEPRLRPELRIERLHDGDTIAVDGLLAVVVLEGRVLFAAGPTATTETAERYDALIVEPDVSDAAALVAHGPAVIALIGLVGDRVAAP